MSDKARGALFNVLGDMHGLSVLDPFAGTGALSFEAMSRGAASAVLIESDKSAQKTIAHNIELLGLRGHARLISATANAWLGTNPDARFDIVLCDPPYDNLQLNLVQSLTDCVDEGGLLVLSWPGKEDVPALPNMELLRSKSYGDITLAFYRKNVLP